MPTIDKSLMGDLAFLGAIVAVAAVIALLRGYQKRRKKWIVLDGSNIMYWVDDTPMLETVASVSRWLEGRGLTPVVWFDANVGYKVSDKYYGRRELSRALALPRQHIHIAPKGSPADPLLLKDAVRKRARVVSNDRFRDWEGKFPKVKEEGFLVRPRTGQGEMSLSL